MKSKSDKTRLFLNSIFITGATIIEKVVFFVINVILARYFLVEDFGYYVTALGYATFFSTFVNIGINQTIVRCINIERHLEREHFANALIVKSVLAVLVYSAMVLSLLFIRDRYSTDTIYLILILGIVRIGNEYMMAFKSLYEAKERFNISSVFTSSFAVTFLMGTVIIVLLKGNYFHVAYIRLAVVLGFIALMAVVTFRKFKVTFNLKTLKPFVLSAIPFSLSTIFSNSYQRINIIILSLMHGEVYSAIFNNGFIFFTTIYFIPGNFNRVIVPYLMKIPHDNKDKFQFAFDIYSKFYAVISFYLFVVILLFSKDLIPLVFGDKYNDSIGVLQYASFAIPFLFTIAGSIIMSLDRQKINTRIQGIAMVINITSNIILINYYTAEGAAMATVLTYFTIYSLSHLYLVREKVVSYRSAFIAIMKLVLFAVPVCLLYFKFFTGLFVIYSFIAVSLLYLFYVLFAVLTGNDIRIIRETLGIGEKK